MDIYKRFNHLEGRSTCDIFLKKALSFFLIVYNKYPECSCICIIGMNNAKEGYCLFQF